MSHSTRPPVQCLLLGFGRHEETRFARVPFAHGVGFATAHDALVDLVATVRAIVGTQKREASRTCLACCRATREAIPTAARCATCGRHLPELIVSLHETARYLESWTTRTVDGSLEDREELALRGWGPGVVEGGIALVENVDGLLDTGYRHYNESARFLDPDRPAEVLDADRVRACFLAGAPR